MKRAFFLMAALAACASERSQVLENRAARWSETFKATLDARNEVPPPNLEASASPVGTANFNVDGTRMVYEIRAAGLSGPPTAAHIHTGAPGVAGPVVVALTVTPGELAGSAKGDGSFDASAVKGKKGDGSAMSWDDLLAAMRSGGTYVNIHTANNKPGEVRGQIQ